MDFDESVLESYIKRCWATLMMVHIGSI